MSTASAHSPFWTEDPDGAAGEYVLGTLSAEERAAFSQALERDASLRAAVAVWEERLAPLASIAPAVMPAPKVWSAIENRILDAAKAGHETGSARILRLERGLRRWRWATGAAGALAAGLAVWIAAVPRPATVDAPQYLAVVDRGGGLPALIVRVDLASGVVQVRSLAAEAPPDHSLELWYINEGEVPRSLGLVSDAIASVPIPPSLRAGVDHAKFAVTVEPPGGAPGGKATGPVIYSGQLIRE